MREAGQEVLANQQQESPRDFSSSLSLSVPESDPQQQALGRYDSDKIVPKTAIVPVVIHGAYDLQPSGSVYAATGRVCVVILEPILTSDVEHTVQDATVEQDSTSGLTMNAHTHATPTSSSIGHQLTHSALQSYGTTLSATSAIDNTRNASMKSNYSAVSTSSIGVLTGLSDLSFKKRPTTNEHGHTVGYGSSNNNNNNKSNGSDIDSIDSPRADSDCNCRLEIASDLADSHGAATRLRLARLLRRRMLQVSNGR
jgi:hypothetical protein